jgi:hypothetical protein
VSSSQFDVVDGARFRRGQVMKFFEALPPCPIGLHAADSTASGCNHRATRLEGVRHIRD